MYGPLVNGPVTGLRFARFYDIAIGETVTGPFTNGPYTENVRGPYVAGLRRMYSRVLINSDSSRISLSQKFRCQTTAPGVLRARLI